MQHIVQLGMHYEETPLKIRERISFTDQAVVEALLALHDEAVIEGIVLIQTCNRTEIYLQTDNLIEASRAVQYYLERTFTLTDVEVMQFLKRRINAQAIEHLFKTVAGLDSLVLGETEILGQVKEAFLLSQNLGTTSKQFNELFKRAIAFGKKIHTDTTIGEQARSVSYVAVNYLENEFGISNKKVLVIGAGDTGERILKNLASKSPKNITLMNRSVSRGRLLADNYQVDYKRLADLPQVLMEVDLVLSATSAPDKIITKEMVATSQAKVFVDLAMPRDIDVKIAELENHHVINLETFHQLIEVNDQARIEAAKEIEKLIQPEMASFQNWISEQEAVPVISALMKRSERIQKTTMESIERKIPTLDAHDKKVLQKHTKSIIHQLLKEPIAQAKQMSQVHGNLEAFEQIFGLRK